MKKHASLSEAGMSNQFRETKRIDNFDVLTFNDDDSLNNQDHTKTEELVISNNESINDDTECGDKINARIGKDLNSTQNCNSINTDSQSQLLQKSKWN